MSISRGDRLRSLREQPDAELVAASHRDADAFGVFYERHQTAVFGYFVHRTGNTNAAEELTSEVFAAAFITSRRYDPERGTPTAWLFGIARNVLQRSYRQRGVEHSSRRQLGIAVGHVSDEVWEQVARRLERTSPELREGLRHLSARERDALHARFVEEREYAEIAADGDTTEAAVRQRVSRALRKLASHLNRGDQ